MSVVGIAGQPQHEGLYAGALHAAREVFNGKLPGRYYDPWRGQFDACIAPLLVPGVRILDAGAGRSPTLDVEDRPPDCTYTGIDISAEELERAGKWAYDAAVVSDVTRLVPEFIGSFDVVISWQVLEHVKPLEQAIENFRSYLRPGGTLVAEMSGSFSAFGLANQVLPHQLARWVAPKLAGREEGSVFPAHYDHCYAGAFERMAGPWQAWRTIPRYLGAFYFGFARPLQAAYVGYEEWALRAKHRNLATHYVIEAVK